jgi:hypothetical protein
MGFFLYLTPIGNNIMNDLAKARFNIRENVGLCSNRDIFGYADKPKKFIICTKNIKSSGYDVRFYLNETVYHEATHAAQNCKGGNNLIGIPKSKMPISGNKLQDIHNSMRLTGNYKVAMREHEAYYLEDKPEKVRYYVKKFCF